MCRLSLTKFCVRSSSYTFVNYDVPPTIVILKQLMSRIIFNILNNWVRIEYSQKSTFRRYVNHSFTLSYPGRTRWSFLPSSSLPSPSSFFSLWLGFVGNLEKTRKTVIQLTRNGINEDHEDYGHNEAFATNDSIDQPAANLTRKRIYRNQRKY